MIVEAKSPLRSRTVWVGLIIVAVSVLGYLQELSVVQDRPGLTCGLGVAVGTLMVTLRLITKRPIDLTVRLPNIGRK